MPQQNYTIDDSQWASAYLSLSPGWNMLQKGGENEFLNASQVADMEPLLETFWNSSISWTTSIGSSNTLTFNGTDIWAYGISGPDQGSYAVYLDDKPVGEYTATTAQANYHHLLYAAHDLTKDAMHSLTLENTQDGKSLAFDVAIVGTGTGIDDPSPTASAAAATQTEQPPSGGLGALLNQTLPSSDTGPSSLMPASPYSSAQLAALLEPYAFHWTPAAYFVVIFSSLVAAMFFVIILRLFGGQRIYDAGFGRNRQGLPNVGGLGRNGEKRRERDRDRERPATRILEALRGRQISNPVVSEGDGVSEGTHGSYVDMEEGRM